MKKFIKDVFLAHVLYEVNKIRHDKNLEPLMTIPQGRRCDGNRCPLGIAIDGRVFIEHNLWHQTKKWKYTTRGNFSSIGSHKLPWGMRWFARLFDRGWFKEYDNSTSTQV